jgi:undecaprenyl-diphosphatase
MIRFDAEAFRRLNNLAGRYPALDAVGVFCARWLLLVMFAAVFVRLYFALRRPEARAFAAMLASTEAHAVAASALAFVGNWVFSMFIFRSRPFVALHDVHRLVPPPLSPHSFPSSHSSVAFALAFSILLVDLPLGLALLVAACAVALGRVYVGVHYPLDIVVGIFVGLFWALTVRFGGAVLGDIEMFKRFLKVKTRL